MEVFNVSPRHPEERCEVMADGKHIDKLERTAKKLKKKEDETTKKLKKTEIRKIKKRAARLAKLKKIKLKRAQLQEFLWTIHDLPDYHHDFKADKAVLRLVPESKVIGAEVIASGKCKL